MLFSILGVLIGLAIAMKIQDIHSHKLMEVILGHDLQMSTNSNRREGIRQELGDLANIRSRIRFGIGSFLIKIIEEYYPLICITSIYGLLIVGLYVDATIVKMLFFHKKE